MTYILNIETATRNCSVALSQDGNIIACKEVAEAGYSHAEKLHIFIDEILKENTITYKDLSAIAISQGPGSYTGLRIGVSAAKGLCYSLDIPLVAIDTLEVLARKITIDSGVIIPMIDARRMECYTAIFDANYINKREVKAEIIDANSFCEITQTIHLIGDGASKCNAVLTDAKFVYHSEIQFPSASEMSKIAFDKYKKNDTVSVAYFEPFYLKDFMMTVVSK
ncbi:tRNA (adenosine(37)-N6)-threonylcarbamoyltransferase complex dimerization subunit type 1 TsaB [Flavobacterium psychrophilum]